MSHLTAKELAGLPGMPKTVKGVIEKGERGEILARPIKKKDGTDGKFREYSIDSLPLETRKALAPQNTKVGYEPAPEIAAAATHAVSVKQNADVKERKRLQARAKSMIEFQRLPAEKQKPANAKLAVIRACARYIHDHRLAKTAGQLSYCHEYALHEIDVAPWVRDLIPSLHPATLRAWIYNERELGMLGLVDSYGNRKDQSKIETWNRLTLEDGRVLAPMADFLVSLLLTHPHISEKHANESLRAKLPESVRVNDKTVKRFLDKWKAQNVQQYALACNPDDHKNRFQPAFGSRSEGINGPNQLWEIDATPADLLLTDGRYKIIGVTDVGTARLKMYATLTERTRDNAFALRRCILDWGVPKDGTLTTDEGSPYVNDRFKGLLNDLNVHQHICQPFSGDEKPHIERAFRTFSHDLVELLPGYCGHNVSDRKAIESRKSFAQRLKDPDQVIEIKMTGAELQAFCDRWCSIYHNTEHSRLGKTPNQALAEWPHPISRIADERALDILLYEPVRPGGKLPIVGKKGIRVAPGTYIHEALEPHLGEFVRCFQDPLSLGRIIVNVLNRDGNWEFLCIAIDPDLDDQGISREEVARATRERHSEHKKIIGRMINAAKKELKGVDLVEAVMTMREKEAAEAQGNVVYFPNPTVPYESAGLTAASQAFAALDAARTDQPADTGQFGQDEIEAAGRRWIELNEARERENKVVALPTAARPMFGTDLDKYQWLKKNPVLQAHDDARWIGWYESTSEYRLMFGEMEEEGELQRN